MVGTGSRHALASSVGVDGVSVAPGGVAGVPALGAGGGVALPRGIARLASASAGAAGLGSDSSPAAPDVPPLPLASAGVVPAELTGVAPLVSAGLVPAELARVALPLASAGLVPAELTGVAP
ncbi:MAG: hypothetical protein JO023_29130, partial [Chloroflexi bacterium]|nr:hypothetical protein [Chloroflexota bacterium]